MNLGFTDFGGGPHGMMASLNYPYRSLWLSSHCRSSDEACSAYADQKCSGPSTYSSVASSRRMLSAALAGDSEVEVDARSRPRARMAMTTGQARQTACVLRRLGPCRGLSRTKRIVSTIDKAALEHRCRLPMPISTGKLCCSISRIAVSWRNISTACMLMWVLKDKGSWQTANRSGLVADRALSTALTSSQCRSQNPLPPNSW